MATLKQITKSIQDIVQDPAAYPDPDIHERINEALQRVAAGVMLPERGSLSPPLPDLFVIGTADTVEGQAWTDLPEEYQRDLERVDGQSLWGVNAPRGGTFYSFALFMDRVPERDLSETGAVYIAAVKGRRLYYQGVPETPETLSLQFYRKPAVLAAETDVPEGIPEHLQRKILTHAVCADIYGEGIEDGENSRGTGLQYHMSRVIDALEEMARFAGEDAAPFHVPEDDDFVFRY